MLEMTPGQCRAARALIDWTQPQLAESSGVGLTTVVDFELGRRKVSRKSTNAMRLALEDAGIVFIAPSKVVGGEGVRLAFAYTAEGAPTETTLEPLSILDSSDMVIRLRSGDGTLPIIMSIDTPELDRKYSKKLDDETRRSKIDKNLANIAKTLDDYYRHLNYKIRARDGSFYISMSLDNTDIDSAFVLDADENTEIDKDLPF